MMEKLNNKNYLPAYNEAELSRQQEAFINSNMLQIEKRRHERSPNRERSYSPTPVPSSQRRERRPYSRERDHRRPPPLNNSWQRNDIGTGSAGRNRRANSRDTYDYRHITKRRKSGSLDRDFKDIGNRVCIIFIYSFVIIFILYLNY